MDSVNDKSGGDVVIQLTLDAFLARLEATVKSNPRDKRDVPSIPELAAAAGVSRGAMYNLVKGHVKQVNLELLTAVVNELRRRGFEVALDDVLVMYPKELVS